MFNFFNVLKNGIVSKNVFKRGLAAKFRLFIHNCGCRLASRFPFLRAHGVFFKNGADAHDACSKNDVGVDDILAAIGSLLDADAHADKDEMVAALESLIKEFERSMKEECSLSPEEIKAAFWKAVERGDAHEMQKYIDKGADVNAVNKKGETPLLYSVRREDGFYAVRCLVNAGADVNTADKNGDTVLMKAAAAGKTAVVECLAQAGAVFDADTALLRASRSGEVSTVRYFIEKCGANVNAQDKNGETALIRATRRGYYKIIDYLVKKAGANVFVKNRKGKTARCYAAFLDQNFLPLQLASKTHLLASLSFENLCLFACVCFFGCGLYLDFRVIVTLFLLLSGLRTLGKFKNVFAADIC